MTDIETLMVRNGIMSLALLLNGIQVKTVNQGGGGKDHWHVDGGKEHLPPGTDVPDFPSEDDPEACPDNSSCQKVATSVVVGGIAYIVYRCVRMVPSLLPPLWPTIPANAIAP